MVAPSLSRATVFSTAGGSCSLVIFRSCAFVTESEIKQPMATNEDLSLKVMDILSMPRALVRVFIGNEKIVLLKHLVVPAMVVFEALHTPKA